MNAALYVDLLGKPFAYGGRGPDAYDCWGLLMELHRRRGIEIPDYKSPTTWVEIHRLMQQNIHLWKPCGQVPNAAMYMRLAAEPHHVATYLGNGHFIHTCEGTNCVVVDKVSRWEKNIVGYYEYRGHH